MTFALQEGLAVCISVYRPQRQLLFALLEAVRPSAGPILLHIDGPTGQAIEADLLSWLKTDGRFTILQATRNAGIGTALNRLAAEAERLGCRALMFLDQDSTPPLAMAQRLDDAFAALEGGGFAPAVVGPALAADPASPSKVPHYRIRPVLGAPPACHAVDYVIISGSLMTLAALRDVGGFRESYRMDAIDVEWCFRAWAKDRSVWQVSDVVMQHRVGEGIVTLGALWFPRQSEARMRCYVRNQFHLLGLDHVPLRWKLRTLTYVPLQILVFVARAPSRRWSIFRQLLQALGRGFSGNFEEKRSGDEPRD